MLAAVGAKYGVDILMGPVQFSDERMVAFVAGAPKGVAISVSDLKPSQASLTPPGSKGHEDSGLAPLEAGDEQRKATPETPLSDWMKKILTERRFTDDYRTVDSGAVLRIYGYSSRNRKNKWLLMSPEGKKYKAPTEFVSKYFGY